MEVAPPPKKLFIKRNLYLIFKYFYRLSLKAYHFRFFFLGDKMLICKTYFSKLQSDPNSDHTITVYAIKKRTFRDPNSHPGETDPYGPCAAGWEF